MQQLWRTKGRTIDEHSEHPSEVATMKPRTNIHTTDGLMEYNSDTEQFEITEFPKQNPLSYFQVRYILPSLQDIVFSD